MQNKQIKNAYVECLWLAHTHYENFPTASRIVEKKHRDATAAIYSFARRADDIADEGELSDSQRHSQLDNFSTMLADTTTDKPTHDATFIALADTINRYQLPTLPFENLLTAFKMDIDKKRFENFDELLFYCQHSANPVGELILRLHDKLDATTQKLSDSICTALQLINFLQDINEDYIQRDRIYIPQDEMKEFNTNETQLREKTNSTNMHQLVDAQLKRASNMLFSGAPLVNHLQGRLKWVMKLTINSALMVCDKLSTRNNVFDRPTLSKLDWLKIVANSIYFRPDQSHAKILLNITNRTPT